MKLSRLFPAFGILMFAFILSGSNLGSVASNISGADPFIMSFALLLFVPMILVKALKWKILVGIYNVPFGLGASAAAWLAGYAVGIITPARLGDLYRAAYLGKKLSLGKSITTIAIDRLIDVIILFTMAAFSVTVFVGSYSGMGNVALAVYVCFSVFAVVSLLVMKKGATRFIMKPMFRIFMPDRLKGRASSIFADFYDGIRHMKSNTGTVMVSVLLGIFSWFITIFQMYLVANAMGLGLGYGYMAMIMPIVLLLETLPISVSGLGTRDAAMIFFFSLASLQADVAVSFSLMIFLVNYVLAGVAGFAVWLWRKPH